MIYPKLRKANYDDAGIIARLIADVSEGLADAVLPITPDLSSYDLLEAAFLMNLGVFRPENVLWIEIDGDTAGMLFAYPARDAEMDPALFNFLGGDRALCLSGVLGENIEDSLWINTLWVADKFRRKGIASFLLHGALKWARATNSHSLSLHCWCDNEAALGLYRKFGFSISRHISSTSTLEKKHSQGAYILTISVNAEEGSCNA
jgi:GNAT superfamily N-acetyltransferase